MKVCFTAGAPGLRDTPAPDRDHTCHGKPKEVIYPVRGP